jgi:general secretion pathway protein I
MARSTDGGFSLIEALVALSVLAVSASVILSATENHTKSVTALTDRTQARWVAQNRLTRLQTGEKTLPARVAMGGQDWRVTQKQSETSDPDLWRVDISVGRAVDPSDIAFLTGFVARGVTP